jgi:hypothetical protein
MVERDTRRWSQAQSPLRIDKPSLHARSMRQIVLASPVAVAAASLALAVGAAVPADAATAVAHDPRGDASAHYDLTKVAVSNTASRFAFTAHVRDLAGGRTQAFMLIVAARDDLGSGTVLRSVRHGNGRVRSVVSGAAADGSGRVSCRPTVTWWLGANVITASFARSCVAQAGDLQLYAALGIGNGLTGDPEDWTTTVVVPQD